MTDVADQAPIRESDVVAEKSVDARVAEVGKRLIRSMRTLVDGLPGGDRRPQQIARSLGLKKDVPSRLLRAMQLEDPVAATHRMPGPEALRRLIDAAEQQGVGDDMIQQARGAVDAFDALIRGVAGDRAAFDTLISAWLPDVRAKVDLAARQAFYRGAVGIKGCAADLKLSTAVLYPSASGQHVDVLWLIGAFGLRRMRAGAVVRFASHHLNAPTSVLSRSISGQTSQEGLTELLSDEFLPSSRVRLNREEYGATVHWVLPDECLGLTSAVNVFMAEAAEACMDRYETSPDKPRKRGPIAEINIPVRTLVFDALVHDALYPDVPPSLHVFDTVLRGVRSMNEPGRQLDRIDHSERVLELGKGLSRLRVPEYPNYADLVRHACSRLKWDATALRAYRCRIAYPVYGAQIHLAFTAPAG